MLHKIIDIALHNRLLVLLSLTGVLLYSAFVIPKLNLDAFPDVTNVQVVVNTEARGLASEEVEKLITYPIESVIYSLPDVEEVRSTSKTGLSSITIVFKEGVDIYFARQLIFQKLQDAKENIPAGVGTPGIGPNTSGLGMVFQYLLEAEPGSGYTPMELRSLNDWVVKLLLMPVEGITSVLSFGGEVKQYQVNIDPELLLAQGLQLDDVMRAVQNNNRNVGGWYMDKGSEQLVIRGEGWVRSGEDGLRDIRRIPLKTVNGTPIRVEDVATVEFGAEVRQGVVMMTRKNEAGEAVHLGEIVAGMVLKRIGANTKETIESIKEKLPVIQRALPDKVKIVPFYDQSDLVDKAVWTVEKALIEAFVLVMVILFLFLMNFSAAMLVLFSIPVSVAAALAIMEHQGISANLMSLGGLTIAIGMMVDGSVVMIENIFKHLEKTPDASHAIHIRILEAAKEVAQPVFYAVIIIIVVFTPLFTLEGVEGKLFIPMALAIVFSMLASLIVAVFVMPVLASYVFTKGIKHKPSPLLEPLAKRYHLLLQKALLAKKKVILTVLGAFFATLAAIPFIGTEFVPELEEGTLLLKVTMKPSISLDEAKSIGKKLEEILLSFPEITYASSHIGRAEVGGDPEPISSNEIWIGVKPVKEWTTASNRLELQDKMRDALSVIPGVTLSFSQPIAMRVDELLSGVKAQLAIKLFGADLALLSKYGKEIEKLAKSVKGLKDIEMEQIAGEAQLIIKPNRESLDRYGIPVNAVMSLVSDAIGGVEAGQVIQGNERYNISVRLKESFRSSAEAIGNLIIQAADGSWVRVSEVASITIEEGPPMIRRDDVQRRVVIQANVEGRDMGSVVAELNKRIDTEIELPVGYTVVYGGQFENQQRAQKRLMIVVPLSLLLIFLFLYFAFSSVGQALLIMLNVPLALIGGIAALMLSGQYLSVPSSIGFIALFGVAVLNGVVLVDAINRHKDDCDDIDEAIRHGAESRFRPVLMTATITALGLIPLLMATGIGSEVQRPLATVVVGGLFSSTILTLFVLPCMYHFFSRALYEERDI